MDTATILRAIEHRPFPLPDGPWVMQQEWHHLLFAHYPIAPDLLRPLIPQSLELDTYERECWVGIVPFDMRHVHPRYLPSVPWLSHFPELNVRTYVKVGGLAGVYFFSLEAGNPLAVAVARSLFYLPYFTARMQIRQLGDTFMYRSHRTHRGAPPADFVANYRPTAEVVYASPSSVEHWFTERYALYTTHRQHAYRGMIQHVQWPLQRAEWELQNSTMAQSHHLPLPAVQPLLHYSRLQEVLVWPLQRVLA